MKLAPYTSRHGARGGFTLIEIMLVVVIIGMLATVAIVNVPKYIDKSSTNTAKAQIKSLGTMLNTYYMENGKYPGSLGELTTGDDPYLEGKIPSDPWGGQYQYSYPGSHKPYKYDLQATKPNGTIIANWNMDEGN
jgi:general secretion pathway protein G